MAARETDTALKSTLLINIGIRRKDYFQRLHYIWTRCCHGRLK